MNPEPPTPTFPHSTKVDARRVRLRMAALAGRSLSRYALLLGAMLASGSSIEWQITAHPMARDRMLLGLVMAVGGLIGWWLTQRRAPRAASLVVLVALSAGLGAHGWINGLGLHTVALPGICLMIALAGMLVGVPGALALTAIYALAVALLAWAEAAGWLPGAETLAALPIRGRVVGLALLGGSGLLAAVLLHRTITTVMLRAVTEQGRLSELLLIGSDWAFEMDRHGRLLYIAPSFEQHTGRTVAEFMRAGLEGGPQVVDDAGWQTVKAAMQARRPYRDCVVIFRCQDGTLLHVRGNADPIFDTDGRYVGYHGVSRNVTAERVAAQEQQRTQAMFEAMVRTSPDAICVARSDGSILLINAGFAAMAGRSEAQILGGKLEDLKIWSNAELRRLRELILHGGGVVHDFRTETHDLQGRHRLVAMSAGMFDWDGQPAAVVTTRDVSDAERERQQSEAILDHASVGIALVREGCFQRVNLQLEQMLGVAHGALDGQSTFVAFPERAQAEALRAQTRAAFISGRAIDVEVEVKRGDSRPRLYRLRSRPLDRQRMRESGSIWVVEDTTERRRAERELAEAKVEADAANHAKSAFLATMSHEIRTPLNGVLGLARLLQDDGLAVARRHEYLSHLVGVAEQLSSIVSDVLDLSKIEAGHLEIEHIAFDLHELIDSSFNTFAPLGHERGLAMSCRIAPGVPRRVIGDPVRVRQILANYLGNALKFTARGEIELALQPGHDNRLRFVVRDTGIGVTPELRQRLFHPFVQADGSTTRRFGGTGLGLSICRELAERMQGSVGVDSDGTSGSVFWAELLLAPEQQTAGTADGAQPADPLRPLHGLRVLVAEDNPVNMLIVCAMLERLGADSVQAHDGLQAVDHALDTALPVSAVLMDLHMPMLDGLAATRKLRADPHTTTLPIFAISAAVLDNERQEALAAGMDGFIAKPVLEAELLRVLLPLAAAALS